MLFDEGLPLAKINLIKNTAKVTKEFLANPNKQAFYENYLERQYTLMFEEGLVLAIQCMSDYGNSPMIDALKSLHQEVKEFKKTL